jgi:hypothetical protein
LFDDGWIGGSAVGLSGLQRGRGLSSLICAEDRVEPREPALAGDSWTARAWGGMGIIGKKTDQQHGLVVGGRLTGGAYGSVEEAGRKEVGVERGSWLIDREYVPVRSAKLFFFFRRGPGKGSSNGSAGDEIVGGGADKPASAGPRT